MTAPALTFSDDQATAYDSVAEMLRAAGIDLSDGLLIPPKSDGAGVAAVIGKAGSGKTLLLSELYKALVEAGLDVVSGDLAGEICKECFANGLIVETSGNRDQVVKILAPLTTPEEQLEKGLAIIADAAQARAEAWGLLNDNSLGRLNVNTNASAPIVTHRVAS